MGKPLLAGLRAGRLLLEYDDPRSGGFEPLREVPGDRIVVLGLVGTKAPGAPPTEEVEARVREASKFAALDRLAVSPQCGFASSVIGNRIGPEDQRRKLELVAEVARRIWS